MLRPKSETPEQSADILQTQSLQYKLCFSDDAHTGEYDDTEACANNTLGNGTGGK